MLRGARSRARGRTPLYLHVGLAKTGTTFLQGLLAENRPALRGAGFIYPFVRPEGMFHAAVEVREDHARWGLDAGVIAGTWAALLDKAKAFPGTAIISHEILAGVTPDQVSRAAELLEGFDVRLVVTARDLGRQVPAHWQEAVKNGETFSFSDFSREVLREPDAPDSQFWNEQDLVAVLDRWTPVADPDHVHVVVCPPAGAERSVLWARFADAVGLPHDVVDVAAAPSANVSLGAAEVALLRRVNAALGGRIGQPAYAHVVKRFFAQRVLSGVGTARAGTPESLRPALSAEAERWVGHLESRGFRLHGSLAELLPTGFTDQHPDDAAGADLAGEMPAVLARLLEEVAALRR